MVSIRLQIGTQLGHTCVLQLDSATRSASLIGRDESFTPRCFDRIPGCNRGGLLFWNLAIMEPGKSRLSVPTGHRGICTLIAQTRAGLMEIFHAPLAIR